MKFITVAIFLGYASLGDSYTKYGRSCKDIGCPSNQMCVMQTDPCSYSQRQGECGSFPTCQKTGNTARTCSTYVCPPTKVCRMDGSTPKCVDDHSQVGLASYDTQNQNTLTGQGHDSNPSAPVQPSSGGGGGIYPNVPRGETTPRPNVYRPPAPGGNGYQGGQIGSGYPGQGGGNSGGHAQPGGYPQQGYQGHGQYPGYQPAGQGYQGGYQPGGYQQGGYQPGGYQQGGYQPGGYQPGGYQPGGYQQGGYQPGGYQGGNQQNSGNRYGQPSSGSSLTDKITSSLKTIGLFCALLNCLLLVYSRQSLNNN